MPMSLFECVHECVCVYVCERDDAPDAAVSLRDSQVERRR